MATTTFNPAHVGVEARPGRGPFRRFLDRVVKAREAEAKRQIARTLWTYSDESLKNMGLTREELARWHAGKVD